jgi:hypothetical protein
MFRAPFWRRLAIATLCALFITLSLSFTVFSHSAFAHAATNPLSIQAVYVTDSAQHPKTSFKSGDAINYHIDATNSSNQTLSVSVVFFADTIINSGGKLRQFIIIDKTFPVSMPPGPSRYYTPSAIPAGVTSASYTLDGQIYENADRNNNASVTSRPLSVTRVSTYPLQVPYFSQFDDSSKNNECGETAVAMAAAYYVDLYNSPKEWIEAVRNQIGVSSSDETNAQQLQNALWGIHGMQITITPIANTTPIAQAVQQIQAATQKGYPVIAFIDATKLVPPRSYVGHWIVITGISGQTVYVNDPDSSSGGTGKHNPTQLSLSVYEAAAQSGAQGQGQPYGLIVNGEDFQSP